MNNNLMQQIMQSELTKSQMRIADYIVKNQKRMLGMTSKEVGKEIGVSDATVIRFARAIGYEGYADLQEHVRKEIKESSEKIGKHSLFDRYVMQFQKYNEMDNSMGEVLQLMSMNLETSIRQNDSSIYKRVAEKILNADRKTVIGFRGGNGCALQFARLLGHITENVNAIVDEGYDQISKLMELDQDDVIVFLNFPRYYIIDEKIENIIKEKNLHCFLITDSMTSPVAQCAEEILLVETEHCGFFHSMIGVEGVLEYLLILMCWQRPEEFRKKLKIRDHVLEEYLI
ncbi:MAG: MurR/RpiR family transcriptional regulator [Lachnospiraceae bacterium]|nr:MurR/RpiR family transcriptional regulator [Lachnospiraceae bacterium]